MVVVMHLTAGRTPGPRGSMALVRNIPIETRELVLTIMLRELVSCILGICNIFAFPLAFGL